MSDSQGFLRPGAHDKDQSLRSMDSMVVAAKAHWLVIVLVLVVAWYFLKKR